MIPEVNDLIIAPFLVAGGCFLIAVFFVVAWAVLLTPRVDDDPHSHPDNLGGQ